MKIKEGGQSLMSAFNVCVMIFYDMVHKTKDENNMDFIQLDQKNIQNEHICCAFSGKKDAVGYQLKKDWLAGEFANEYRFIRLNERAKVFIEYGPAEKSWNPIVAPNYFVLGCFWVAGQYKGKGYGKQLIQMAIEDARKNKKDGLVAAAKKRGLPLKIVKFETAADAQKSPSPNTIFSLFYNGKFITTDMSCCLDSRFDKITNIKI